jgi:hypothetical protein
MAAGIWFASTFMNPMDSKLKRIAYLVSPASNLEKYLTRWIITTIGYILAFFAALWMADIIRVAICAVKFPEVGIQLIDLTKLTGQYTGPSFWREYVVEKDAFSTTVRLYFLLQSLFLLGATFWERASFIKTFASLAVIIAAFILICRWTILLFYGDLAGYNNVMMSFEINQTLSKEQAIFYAAILMSVVTVSCWILAFFRIRESEIIQRL